MQKLLLLISLSSNNVGVYEAIGQQSLDLLWQKVQDLVNSVQVGEPVEFNDSYIHFLE